MIENFLTFLTILGTISLIFVSLLLISTAYGGQCGDPAPLPHYTEEKGYGYMPSVEPNKDYPNCILKNWRVGKTYEIFVDMGQNGECDKVYIFEEVGTNDDGDPLLQFRGLRTCEEIEDQIKQYLKIKLKKTTSKN